MAVNEEAVRDFGAELDALSDEPKPAVDPAADSPVVGTSETAKAFESDGTFDAVARQREGDKSRERDDGFFGSVAGAVSGWVDAAASSYRKAYKETYGHDFSDAFNTVTAPVQQIGEAYKRGHEEISKAYAQTDAEALRDLAARGEFARGVNRGMAGFASSVASGLEHAGESLGESYPALKPATERLRKYGAENAARMTWLREQPEMAARIARMADIRKESWFNDTVDYIVSSVGEGAGSIIPAATLGVATGGVGVVPVFWASGMGEVRQQFEQEGVDPKDHAKLIALAGAVHGALEYIPGMKTLMGAISGNVKQEVSKNITRAIARGFVSGGIKEGVTEGMQTAIELTTVVYAKTGSTLQMYDKVKDDLSGGIESQILEAAVKGALAGGPFEAGVHGATFKAPQKEKDKDEDAGRVREARASTSSTSDAPTATDVEQVPMVSGKVKPKPGTQTVKEARGKPPSFVDVMKALPTNEAGEPDTAALVNEIAALGKTKFSDLTAAEKRALLDKIKGQQPAQAETPAEAPQAGPETTAAPAKPQEPGIADEIAAATRKSQIAAIAERAGIAIDDATYDLPLDDLRAHVRQALAPKESPETAALRARLDGLTSKAKLAAAAEELGVVVPEGTAAEMRAAILARAITPQQDGQAAGGVQAPAVAPSKTQSVAAPAAASLDRFLDLLEGKSTRPTWARQLGISEDQLAPLIDQAVAAGWLETRKGQPRRVPANKRPARPVARGAESSDITATQTEPTNADGRALEGPAGSLPQGGVPEATGADAQGQDAGSAPGSDRPGGDGALAGDGGRDADGAGSPGGLRGADEGDGGDTGVGAGDRQRGTDTPATPDLTAQLDAVRDTIVEQAKKQEQARRDRVANNYRITDADEIGKGGPKAKVRANIAAIRVLRQIEAEGNRPATAEEKAILVKYTGWGQFSQAMFADARYNNTAKEWAKERAELLDLLSPEELATAKGSTLNAHYTSPDVIKGMWQALEHLGFKGGRVLEPSAGIGHFIGYTPAHLREATDWTAVELDKVSGGITKALYGAADVRVNGFEKEQWPDNFFDLAISNVPFGDYVVQDDRTKGLFIHDYFFVKGLQKVREGGIVAFITSKGTLDKMDLRARTAMARSADFLGAIRLPGGNKGAFKANAGTDVTTDIIFLRKRVAGAPQGDTSWMDLAEIKTPEGPTRINAYFAQHPEMMLGKMRLIGTMRRSDEPVLIGPTENLDEKIAAAATSENGLPANAMLDRGTAAADLVEDVDTNTDGIKPGAFYVKDGKPFRKVFGVGQAQKMGAAEVRKLEKFVGIRDVVNTMLAKQAAGDTAGMADLRADLNKAYDAFVKAHGPINKVIKSTSKRLDKTGQPIETRRSPNFDPFEDDPDAYKVAALEIYDEASDSARKTAIFTEDILQAYTTPEITGPADALAVSLNERGKVDMGLIAERLGVSEPEAAAMLEGHVFLDPNGLQWQARSRYLSGDVITKLEEARAAAKTDGRFDGNVAALEAVQPEPLTRFDPIIVNFGAPWVPGEVLTDFFADVLGTKNLAVKQDPVTKKRYAEFTSRWGQWSAAAQTEFGTPEVSVARVVEAALNQSPINVWTGTGENRVRNPKAEEAAAAKVKMLRERFSGNPDEGIDAWVWQDEARARFIEATYNRAFNRLVPESFDGAHLTFPGLARVLSFADGTTGTINLTPPRVNAIWRMIQSGNTLLAHMVGGGKTFTMVMGAMEMKRLGLIRRPMFVVPNHMLNQFSTEFLQAYPGAKILVATKESMSKAKRKEFAARAAADNWDAIIIRHDTFGRVRMSDQAYSDFYQEMMNELEAAKQGAEESTVKDLEKAKKRLQAKLDKLLNAASKDEGITFEELGTDFLFVDEAHLYKNLEFATTYTRVGGVSPRGSQRALDLFVKMRHLEKSRPGRSAVFATATPLSRSMAEIFTMQRYLQNHTLQEYGIESFDEWARAFGEVVSKVELAPNGRDHRDNSSFSRFVNMPELHAILGKVADFQTAETLKIKRPDVEGGRAQIVEADLSDAEEAEIQRIIEDIARLKGTPPVKGAPNHLSLFTQGLQVATDMRLLDPSASFNPNGKIAKLVANVKQIWTEGNADPNAPNKAQIIFLDMGVPGSKGQARVRKPGGEADITQETPEEIAARIRERLAGVDPETGEVDEAAQKDAEVAALLEGKFNLYADIKERLVADGVPADEIAFIHDYNSDDAKAKLFQAVRDGKVRVLIGSTGKMGVGTNVQKRLIAMHHVDAPWNPADIEQRDGRIRRQGNLNPTVKILRYVTKRSFDAYRWQLIERKADFTAAFMAGARGVRVAEDIDSPLPEAAELKAAASGDPRILQEAELKKDVARLEVQRAGHLRSIADAKTAGDAIRSRIDRVKRLIGGYDTDAAKVQDLTGDKFAVTLTVTRSPVTVTDRKKAGEAIRDYLVAVGERSYWGGSGSTLDLGQISGFAMQAKVRSTDIGIEVEGWIQGAERYDLAERFALTAEANPVALIQRFERLVRGVQPAAAAAKTAIAEMEGQLPALDERAKGAAFPKQALLDKAKTDLAHLQAALKGNLKQVLAAAADEMAVEDYVAQAMRNLMATSRTAQGVVDTSASAGKSEKMAEGLTGAQAASSAQQNFARVIRSLYQGRDTIPLDPEGLAAFVDQVAVDINAGILKEGALFRTDNSAKYPYTDAAAIPAARAQFAVELAKRLSDPAADPVETAAWVEWRVNLTDHIYADGVGKTSKALAAIPLMRAGVALPEYRSNEEFFAAAAQRVVHDPADGPDSYLDEVWQNFLAYYRTLMPPEKYSEADYARREAKMRARMEQEDWKAATIPDMSRDTQKQPGFWSPDWKAARTYNRVGEDEKPTGETFRGYEAAISYLIERARGKVAAPRAEHKMFLLLGMPGAGKSTIAKAISARHGAVSLDADQAKIIIPEYDGGKNSGGVHEEASATMKDVIGRMAGSGENIILEKLGSSDGSVMGLVDQFTAVGYKIIVLNVDVPKALAMERAVDRYNKTGRAVPVSEFDRTALNLPKLMLKLSMEGHADEAETVRFSERADRWEADSVSGVEVEGLWPRPGAAQGNLGVDAVDRGPGNDRGRGGSRGATEGEGGQVAPLAVSGPLFAIAGGTAEDWRSITTIYTPDGTMSLPVRTEIVELSDLKVLRKKSALQPRDRESAESKAQVASRARNLDVARLLPRVESGGGAPLILPDGTVLSGNGRVLAIETAYATPSLADSVAEYRAAMGPEAAGMSQPVLIQRVTEERPTDELATFAELSNIRNPEMKVEQPTPSDQALFALAASHVSAADFDGRFDLNHVGSGEQGEFQGWGFYFTDDLALSDYFAKVHLSGTPQEFAALSAEDRQTLAAVAGRIVRGQTSVERELAVATNPTYISALQRAKAEKDRLNIVTDGSRAQRYDVELSVGMEEMLDGRAPLSEQAPKVRAALQKLVPGANAATPGSAVYAALARTLGSQRAASDALKAEGIRGARHENLGTRPSGIKGLLGLAKPSYTYVIWDETAIKTVAKNGRPLDTAALFAVARAQDLDRASVERRQAVGDSFREALAATSKMLPPGVKVRVFDALHQLPSGLREQAEAATTASLAALENAVRVGLSPAQLRLVSRSAAMALRGQTVEGVFYGGDIWLASFAMEKAGRIAHEGVHALRQLSLMSDQELAILAERGRKIPDAEYAGHFNRATYRAVLRGNPNAVEIMNQEEAAHLIERRVRDGASYGKQVDSIIDRVAAFIERLGNFLRGRGFRSATDVIDAVLSGAMARKRLALPSDAVFALADASNGIATFANPDTVSVLSYSAPPPVDGIALRGPALFAIRAFHGSPHDFDRFDISKIGTGEGAQAYGHGLYFAESEGVAKSYRFALSGQPEPKWNGASDPTAGQKAVLVAMRSPGVTQDGKVNVSLLQGELESSLEYNRRLIASGGGKSRRRANPIDFARWQQNAAAAEAGLSEIKSTLQNVTFDAPGRLYEVRINANPDHFLDWDKPLSQQSEAVREAYEKALTSRGGPSIEKIGDSSLGSSGSGLHNLLSAWSKHDDAAVSGALREAGIPGIKYLDQGSRAAGEGTRNYVVFDDSLIEIVAKDGVPVSEREKQDILAAMRGSTSAATAATQAAARIKTGLDVYAPVANVKTTFDAITPVLDAVPEGVSIGVIDRIEPNGKQPPRAVFRTQDGRELSLVADLGLISNLRAGFIAGLNAIVFGRLSAPGNLRELVTGEAWHEVTHARIRNRLIPDGDVTALVDHAESLGVMARDLQEHLFLIGDEAAFEAPVGVSVRDTYEYLYKDRENFKALMDEEAVAHMVEMVHHGALTRDELGPVADLVEAHFPGLVVRSAPSGERADVGPLFAFGGVNAKTADREALEPEVVSAAERFDPSMPREMRSPHWPKSWFEDYSTGVGVPIPRSKWDANTIERARLHVRDMEAKQAVDAIIDPIMHNGGQTPFAMSRVEAERLAMQDPEKRQALEDAYGHKTAYYEHSHPNWRDDPAGGFNYPRPPGDDSAVQAFIDSFSVAPRLSGEVVPESKRIARGVSDVDPLFALADWEANRAKQSKAKASLVRRALDKNGKPFIVRFVEDGDDLTAFIHADRLADTADADLPLTAKPYGKPIGSVDLRHMGVGHFATHGHRNPLYEVAMVEVNPKSRRRGLATATYRLIEETLGTKMQPSGILYADGYRRWLRDDPEAVRGHRPMDPDDEDTSYYSPKHIKTYLDYTERRLSAFDVADEMRRSLEQREREKADTYARYSAAAGVSEEFLRTADKERIAEALRAVDLTPALVQGWHKERYASGDAVKRETVVQDIASYFVSPRMRDPEMDRADVAYWVDRDLKRLKTDLATYRAMWRSIPADLKKPKALEAMFALADSRATVTLYRGERPGRAYNDPRQGVWWTTDLDRAHGYAGPGGTVVAIDVSAADLYQARVGSNPTSRTILRNARNASEYIVPEEFHGNRRGVDRDGTALFALNDPIDRFLAPTKIKALGTIIADLKAALGMAATQGRYGFEVIEPSTGRSFGARLTRAGRAVLQMGGRFRAQGGLQAQYDRSVGAMRYRYVTDTAAVAHEAGHHIETMFARSPVEMTVDINGVPTVAVSNPLEQFKQRHADELMGFAYTSDAADLSEGFARWFETYITNLDEATRKAPQITAEWGDFLDAERPELLDLLDRLHDLTAQEDYKAYLDATRLERRATDLVSNADHRLTTRAYNLLKDIGQGDTISGAASRIYAGGIDENHPHYLVVKKMLETMDANGQFRNGPPPSLAVHENPYKLMRSMGDAFKTGLMWIQNGVPNYRQADAGYRVTARDGRVLGTYPTQAEAQAVADQQQEPVEVATYAGYRSAALHDALMLALGDRWDWAKYQQFGAYLVSRRAIHEWQNWVDKQDRIEALTRQIIDHGDTLSELRDELNKVRAKHERRQTDATRQNAVLGRIERDLRQATNQETAALSTIANPDASSRNVLIARDRLAEARRTINALEDQRQAAMDRSAGASRDGSALQSTIDLLSGEIADTQRAIEQRRGDLKTTRERGLQREPLARIAGPASTPAEEIAAHKEDMAQLDAEHAGFAEAAKMVSDYLWQSAVHDRQAGRLTQAELDYRATRRDFYVPFARDLSDYLDERGFGGRQAGKRFGKDKAYKGSDRATINPIETIIDQTFHRAAATHFNEVMGAYAALADRAGPGGAAILERVTRDQMIDADEGGFAQLQQQLEAQGFDADDAREMVKRIEADFGDTQLLLRWTPDSMGAKRPLLMPLWVDGERQYIRINDPDHAATVYNSVNGIGRELSNLFLDAVSKPATVLRAGVTMSPAFILPNIIRDAWSAFILTGRLLDPRTWPLVVQARGLYHELAQTDAARMYQEVAGLMGGQNVAALSKVRDKADVMALREDGLHIHPLRLTVTSSLGAAAGFATLGPLAAPFGAILGAGFSNGVSNFVTTLAHFSDMSETATRLGTFTSAYRAALRNNPSLTPYQAAQEAAFVARDLIDFGRRGGNMLAAARLVPFLNANVQGLDKAVRTLLARSDRGYVLGAEKIGTLTAASAVAGTLAAGPIGGAVAASVAPALATQLAVHSDAARRLLAPFTKRDMGLELSADEERMLGESAKAWANLMLYTLILVGFMALYRDDDEYKRISDRMKVRSQPVKLGGQWYQIPKAFEFAVPSNIIEAAIAMQADGDPRFWERVREGLTDVLAPPFVPQTVRLWSDIRSNYNSLSGRPIVPEHMKVLPPQEQFNAYASQMALFISRAVNKRPWLKDTVEGAGRTLFASKNFELSPAIIDYAISTGLGYWGKDAQKVSNIARDAGPKSNRITEYPLVGTIVQRLSIDPNRLADSKEAFWKLMGREGESLPRASAGYEKVLKDGGQKAANDYLSSLETDDERAYALLEAQPSAARRRYHPLNRAKEVLGAANSIERDALLETLANTESPGDPKKIPLSPAQLAEVRDVMAQIGALETQNALNLMKHKQFGTRKEIDVEPSLRLLRSISADVADEYERRLRRRKVRDWADVKAEWPPLQKELLDDWKQAQAASADLAHKKRRAPR